MSKSVVRRVSVDFDKFVKDLKRSKFNKLSEVDITDKIAKELKSGLMVGNIHIKKKKRGRDFFFDF